MKYAFSKIWILIIIIVILGGGFLAWQYFGTPKEGEGPEGEKEISTEISDYIPLVEEDSCQAVSEERTKIGIIPCTEKDLCYWKLAMEEKDPNTCDKIETSIARDYCYIELAVILDDLTLCNQIESSSNKKTCQDKTNFWATREELNQQYEPYQPEPIEQWNVYRNEEYGFELKYPEGSKIEEIMTENWQGKKVLRLDFPFTSETKLKEKYLTIILGEGSPETCCSGCSTGVSEEVSINGIDFSKEIAGDCAMQSCYGYEDYYTTKDDGCFSLSFVLYYTTVNSPEYTAAWELMDFDKDQEAIIFDQMLSTFRFIEVTGEESTIEIEETGEELTGGFEAVVGKPARKKVRDIYALLVSKTNLNQLEPMAEFYQLLTNNFNVTPNNITFLAIGNEIPADHTTIIDGFATKDNFLNALTDLGQKVEKNDLLIVNIEAHGYGYKGYHPKKPNGIAYHGFCGVTPLIAHPQKTNEERDYLESEFELSIFCGSGLITGHDFHAGLDEWVVSWYPNSKIKRWKFSSHYENAYVEGVGLISDNDEDIDKFTDYMLGDHNQNGRIDESAGEVWDYDGDGISPYDRYTGVFDEDDWGEINEFTNDSQETHSKLGSIPFRIFDRNLDNKLDIDVYPADSGQCGDVTGDGIVDKNDVDLLMNYVSYPGDYSISSGWSGDVTCDKKIDVGDTILLYNYVNKPGEYELSCCSRYEIDGTDVDNDGCIEGIDINDDGDMNDWVSINEEIILNDYTITDDEMAEHFSDIKGGTKIFITNTCYGGGFIYDLSGKNNIIMAGNLEIAASTAALFNKLLNEAFLEHSDYADSDQNGCISITEAFNYIGEHPFLGTAEGQDLFQYDDNGDGVSHMYPLPNGGDGDFGATIYLDGNCGQ